MTWIPRLRGEIRILALRIALPGFGAGGSQGARCKVIRGVYRVHPTGPDPWDRVPLESRGGGPAALRPQVALWVLEFGPLNPYFTEQSSDSIRGLHSRTYRATCGLEATGSPPLSGRGNHSSDSEGRLCLLGSPSLM